MPLAAVESAAPGQPVIPSDMEQPQAAAASSPTAAVAAPAGEPPVAPPAGPSPQARQALQAMVPEAVAGQVSRAPLLANAVAALAAPAASVMPGPLRQALAALVATALDPTDLTAPALRQAIAGSGTFQEASILRLAAQLTGAPALPDTKQAGAAIGRKPLAALSLPSDPALPAAFDDDVAALRADAKSVLLALRSVLQAMPGAQVAQPVPQNADSSPALPRLDALPAGQAASEADPGLRAGPEKMTQALLGATEGALDRVRLLQAASMPDNPRQPDGPQRFDRLMELPLALPGGQMPVMSLAVGRDGRAANAAEAPAWRMRLSLDLPPSGPMHALVSLRGGRAGVTLWAEKSETADQFRAALPELRDALHVVDLDIDSLEVLTGAPPGNKPARVGKAVDRRS